jgi:hypothetical protein
MKAKSTTDVCRSYPSAESDNDNDVRESRESTLLYAALYLALYSTS